MGVTNDAALRNELLATVRRMMQQHIALQIAALRIPARTTDPTSPTTGQMWLRTDL